MIKLAQEKKFLGCSSNIMGNRLPSKNQEAFQQEQFLDTIMCKLQQFSKNIHLEKRKKNNFLRNLIKKKLKKKKKKKSVPKIYVERCKIILQCIENGRL